jgi:hypothetical protein
MQDLAHEIVALATGGAASAAIFGNWQRLGDVYEIRRVVRVAQPVRCFQLQVARLSADDFEFNGPDDYDPRDDMSQQEWHTVLAFGTAASALMCAGESKQWRVMTTTSDDDTTSPWRWVATFDTRRAAAHVLSEVV